MFFFFFLCSELANLGASPDLLLLLLHSMEREQARHDSEISRLMQEADFRKKPLEKSRSNTNNQDSGSRIDDSLLKAVSDLLNAVNRLLTQQSCSVNTKNYSMTPINDCYPVDEW